MFACDAHMSDEEKKTGKIIFPEEAWLWADKEILWYTALNSTRRLKTWPVNRCLSCSANIMYGSISIRALKPYTQPVRVILLMILTVYWEKMLSPVTLFAGIGQKMGQKSLIKRDNADNMYICSGQIKGETTMYRQSQNYIIEWE